MIKLVMVLHCHQPVGNFDSVFEMAHDQCYRPVLELLKAHPKVKTGLHFSGPLLEWLERHRPDTVDILADMVNTGQAEMLSGGFYEPLLATIPPSDARGQMVMMNDWLERRTGRRPNGFWLTERIWDPDLPAVLHGTGMNYTVVDDTHFYYAGLDPENIFGPYVTEKAGHKLTILATPMVMRYMVPFYKVDEVIGQLRTWEQAGKTVAVYGDDGEKFGVWPGTHEWVIEKGWLDRFLTAVEAESDWLQTATPSEYLASAKPLGRLYMPQASYEEMTEWALPPKRGQALEDMIKQLKESGKWDAWRPFVRGGVWDNFLIKYEETNRMHKKMLFLSGRAADLPEARDAVWRAQCNCAYWHGIFGGLYLGHLRRAIHENLIRAAGLLNASTGGKVDVHQVDVDMDGFDEVIVEGPSMTLGLDPADGGTMYELCHVAKRLNLSDVLTRRLEAYHHRLLEAQQGGGQDQPASIHDSVKAKEENLDQYLIYDPYPKVSLVDHFYADEYPTERFVRNEVPEAGDFVMKPYEASLVESSPERARVELVRTGRVGQTPAKVTKMVEADTGSTLTVTYAFEGLEGETWTGFHGCEFNLSLYSDRDEKRYCYAPESHRRREAYESGAEYNITRFELVNGGDGLKTTFTFSRPVMAVFFPILTVSMSEEGFEKTYQGTSLYFLTWVRLEPGRRESLTIKVDLTEM